MGDGPTQASGVIGTLAPRGDGGEGDAMADERAWDSDHEGSLAPLGLKLLPGFLRSLALDGGEKGTVLGTRSYRAGLGSWKGNLEWQRRSKKGLD